MSTLADIRGELFTALETIDDVEVYKRRLANYQYPAIIVGWPQSLDVRPYLGPTPRQFVIDVTVAVEATDDVSADIRLEELLEAAVEALTPDDQPEWTVQTVTDFSEQLLADGRTVIACRLPVAVIA